MWRELVLPLLRDVPENVRDICAYGFTEIVNNVRDHSESPDVLIGAELSASRITMTVIDHGVGIFNKIMRLCDLEDERHAVLELTKGKLTTDPERHTGEGILLHVADVRFLFLAFGDPLPRLSGGQRLVA